MSPALAGVLEQLTAELAAAEQTPQTAELRHLLDEDDQAFAALAIYTTTPITERGGAV